VALDTIPVGIMAVVQNQNRVVDNLVGGNQIPVLSGSKLQKV